MQWLVTGLAVPIVVGLLSAFGATWYSNKKTVERLRREADDRAADAVRAYIRALRNTAYYFEAQAQRYGDWNPARSIINPGGEDAVKAAFNAAAPYFHRLDVRPEDKFPLANALPDFGDHNMEGADNFYERAEHVQTVLDRGLKR
jgi:hypothetical protein